MGSIKATLAGIKQGTWARWAGHGETAHLAGPDPGPSDPAPTPPETSPPVPVPEPPPTSHVKNALVPIEVPHDPRPPLV